MRILIINPPHTAIGSRVPDDHLPPLGLLSLAGPLIDDGHDVYLLDCEFKPLGLDEIVNFTLNYEPETVLLGHSGSSTAQPIIDDITYEIKRKNPYIKTIVGGVYPTYHWNRILQESPQIDVIVCGEGEETIRRLIKAFEMKYPLQAIDGIAYVVDGIARKTHAAPIIQDLDQYRVAWELTTQNIYSYWGKKKAVVAQFSRGCPYPCTYCGQSIFWKRWRHRDPVLFAKELAMLHREYGIEVINFADENPTTNKKVWKQFLEALIAEDVNLILVASTRADNIVRDEDIMHLYKKAGFDRFLLGTENVDEETLIKIKKAGSVQTDRKAIEIMRKHNIISMATYVVGFRDESIKDYWKSYRTLTSYDPDQVQILFVTPHMWTPYYDEVKAHFIVQEDQRKWDYKHQVVDTRNMHPFVVMLCVKLLEVSMQMRPKALARVIFNKEKRFRDAMKWYYKIGRRVWFFEWYHFLFTEKRSKRQITIKDFWESINKRRLIQVKSEPISA